MWAENPLAGISIATTGPDPATARIVAISHRTVNDGVCAPAETTLVNPGPAVTIPPAAARIHGITSVEGGYSTADALTATLGFTRLLAEKGIPLVTFNGAWLWDVVRNEAARIGMPIAIPENLNFVDPWIIDSHLTPARRSGKRTLSALCSSWGIPQEQYGHPADNLNAALRLSWKIGTSIASVRDMEADELTVAQRAWSQEREHDRTTYLASRGKEHLAVVGY